MNVLQEVQKNVHFFMRGRPTVCISGKFPHVQQKAGQRHHLTHRHIKQGQERLLPEPLFR